MRQNVYLLAFVLLLAVCMPASATLQLTLSSGVGPAIVVNDNVAGDSNPAAGVITFIGPVGNWTINVTTGLIANSPLIDLNSTDTVAGGGSGINALTLQFSATDYTGPVNGLNSRIGGTLGSGANLTYQGYVNGNNALNGTVTPIGALQSFGPGPVQFSGVVHGGSAGPGMFSLTQVVTISGSGQGINSSFDAAIDPVPEPASVALLGGALLMTMGFVRRKIRR
jgi:hypothetical protein